MKKISLFFLKSAKNLLPTSKKYGAPPGIIAAMDFPHNLVRTVMCGYYVSPDEAKTIGGAAWSIFDPTQHQGESARNAVYRAYRIEGVISTGAGDTIVLELSFYDKGGKKPFFTARSFFNRIHGTVCALGGYSETCG